MLSPSLLGDGVVVVVASGLICACSDEGALSPSAAEAVTEMAEEEESPDGDCDEDDTTWPRRGKWQALSFEAVTSEAVRRLQFHT